ncbi:MAG: FeoB-associated Cys-rich membrane protein [Clostridia bacterium]|nr:FeoB-associated Cys-rich membrane protein [Clostridia bacterium]
MGTGEIIAVIIIALIIGLATFYIIKAKKSGKKCIGCPDGCNCKGEKGSCPNCSHCNSDK